MDSASKIKVKPGRIVTRIEEIDTTIELRFSKPVDEQMLSLFETIQETQYKVEKIDRKECFALVSQTLNRAQRCLAKKDCCGIDELAQDISHLALKIGAAQLLSSAIEVQGLARIRDIEALSDLLGRMEVELVQVKAHYQ